MPAPDTHVVDLVRDFLEAHSRFESVASHYRDGVLEFEEVRSLVGESDRSVLYRLKERCHDLYRRKAAEPTEIGPGELFDLTVGSLFHEAMAFRESFYQRATYGPKLDDLRRSELEEAQALLPRFERILADAEPRIRESLEETGQLLARISKQLRALLRAHVGEGSLARFLIERGDEVAERIGSTSDALLSHLYGSTAAARMTAAQSYLESGFFAESRGALQGVDTAEGRALIDYADGMVAYLDRDYDGCVASLVRWLEAGDPDPGLAELAMSAVGRAEMLAESGDGLPGAADLTKGLRALLESR